MEATVESITIKKHLIRASVGDMQKSAKVVDLLYVCDSENGIRRQRRGKYFSYWDGETKIVDKECIERIKKLGIPPAWENVWICKHENGHLQATGYDAMNRKQYRYHSRWNLIRKKTKYYRLYEFGKQIPNIRATIDQHLALRGYPREKILAAAISLMEQTSIRVGNSLYEKLYGSFGLTTLKNRHLKVTGSKICFTFKGKKGVKHNITLKSKKLARIIKACKEIPGKDLFEFYDAEGNIQTINSGMVNTYIQQITGANFTAKDFRTWVGTVTALEALQKGGGYETKTEMNQKIASAYDAVAQQLGNTRTVCKNYYVHPLVVELYKEKKLDKFCNTLLDKSSVETCKEMLPVENILLKILEKN